MFYKNLLVLALLLFSFNAKAQSVNSAYLCMSDGAIVLADFDTCSVQDVVTQNNYLLGDIAEGDTPTSLYGVDYSNIYTIDLIAQEMRPLGALSFIGTSGAYLNSLVRESEGTLLAVSGDSTGSLYRIDVQNLTATLLGATGYASAGDLTFYEGELFLSATGGGLVRVDIENPSSSELIGSMNAGGFADIFGVVTVIQGDPCAGDVNYEMIATGGRDTRVVDVTTGATSALCSNLFSGRSIFGAAEVTVATLCQLNLELNAVSPVCSGETLTVESTVDPDEAIGTFTYEWYEVGSSQVLSTQPNFTATFDRTTVLECVVTDADRVAPYQTARAEITVEVTPSPVIDAIEDVVAVDTFTLPNITGIAIPDNMVFTTEALGEGTVYRPGEQITIADFSSFPVRLYMYAENELGCSAQESFELMIYSAEDVTDLGRFLIDAPAFFTPNGDGYHDLWSVDFQENVLLDEVSIYDRFGKLLKRLNPNNLNWDGKYNGVDMPSNEYWFSIYYRYQERQLEYRGHFTLKR